MAGIDNIRDQLKVKTDALFIRIGKLTKVQRLLICLVTFSLIGGGYYYFIFAPKHEALKSAIAELKTQENKLSSFKIKARSLAKFEKQIEEAREKFNIAMKALPDKKELPSLLTGVSKAGSNAGLEFLLFQPDPVVNKEFYKEIPLSMTVKGNYHQVADFFFQVAGLNRIVNIQNVSIATDAKNKGLLTMKCSAVTYMFAEKAEEKSKGKKKKK
ncbi:MAG: type 4a pilus biogenesis protein PilO [Desulfobacterales bacterium]|nr:type 4a pilus biogenesis protein PilO [Desulfobacterales bacterium]